MEFIITRTSDRGWGIEEHSLPPVKGAYPKEIVETFSVKYNGKEIEPWFLQDGYNHRIEGCWCRRDKKVMVWAIEVNSLEDLVKLRDKCKNDLILGRHDDASEYPELEIYDDWRE